MADLQLGSQGEDVATIQRWLAAWRAKHPNSKMPPVTVNGVYDEATKQAVRVLQGDFLHRGATGIWDAATLKGVTDIARYTQRSKTASPFAAHNTIAQDRRWIVEQYTALYGRPPTAAELEDDVDQLQRGVTTVKMMGVLERRFAPEAVTKIFHDVYGREPTAAERKTWEDQLRTGRTTRAGATAYLSSTQEALTRAKTVAPSEEAEDSRVQMNKMLDDIGLASLKDWAWEQIQSGHNSSRILADLRETEAYKVRFRGLVQRVENGLPAMSEDEYLQYETQAEQLMRANGLPSAFRNQDTYADLIAGNVSPVELQERIQAGFVQVNMAPVEVRDKFAEWFGAAGDSALAAYFLDKDKALPALREQIATAEVGGIGDQFDLDFTYDRATKIAQAGVTGDEARQGFAQLGQIDPLFSETISETDDLTAEDEGADAVFNLGGDGAAELERRGRERTAAFSGGGGAATSSKGIGTGTSD